MKNSDSKFRKMFFWNNIFRKEQNKKTTENFVANLPSLSDLRVDDIAVPKADVIAISEDSSPKDISEIFRKFDSQW